MGTEIVEFGLKAVGMGVSAVFSEVTVPVALDIAVYEIKLDNHP